MTIINSGASRFYFSFIFPVTVRMKRLIVSLSPFSWGLLLLISMYLIEYYTGVSISVGYVLSVLFILWFSWRNPYTTWLGILPTILIIVGFFLIHNNLDIHIGVNRLLAIATVWIAVIFVNRYRKAVENEELQKRQLEALFENATEGMIFTNSTGEIVRINPVAEKMFGYDQGELLGKKIELLVPNRFAQAHRGQRNKLFDHPQARPKGLGRELIGRRKSGDEFDAEISLSYFRDRDQVFYIAFIVDISERIKQRKTIAANVGNIQRLNADLDLKVKLRTAELETALINLGSANTELKREIDQRRRAEQRLRKSQQLHAAIARNFPEGVIGVLDRNMRYVLADGQELTKIGFSFIDPIGEHLFGRDNIKLSEEAEKRMSAVFNGQHVSFDIDIADNVYNMTAVPLPDGSGEINEVLVVLKNITERKMAERKLVRTIEKEKELGALKSRFVTMASHEFRTPLGTMLSSVFLLQNYSGEKYEGQKKTHLERIKRSIQTLTELMNDFLSIGSLEEGKIKAVFTAVEMSGFMKEVIAELNSIKKPGQQLILSFEQEGLQLMTDRQMLTNILRNLVSNAVKYSPDDAPIRVTCSVDDQNLVIAVSDVGMGIPEHEQSEIFKRFYRAENAANIQGTGLGLNIVRKYVRLLNGAIEFRSKVNEGTTFTVRLPLQTKTQAQFVD